MSQYEQTAMVHKSHNGIKESIERVTDKRCQSMIEVGMSERASAFYVLRYLKHLRFDTYKNTEWLHPFLNGMIQGYEVKL
jgi:hypothetical protein